MLIQKAGASNWAKLTKRRKWFDDLSAHNQSGKISIVSTMVIDERNRTATETITDYQQQVPTRWIKTIVVKSSVTTDDHVAERMRRPNVKAPVNLQPEQVKD